MREKERRQRQTFTENVIAVVRSIPSGKVSTYGMVAQYAGNRMAARQVARVLHSCSEKEALPWHRVVNRDGRIVISYDQAIIQRLLLEDEGIEIGPGDRICLEKYLWRAESE